MTYNPYILLYLKKIAFLFPKKIEKNFKTYKSKKKIIKLLFFMILNIFILFFKKN